MGFSSVRRMDETVPVFLDYCIRSEEPRRINSTGPHCSIDKIFKQVHISAPGVGCEHVSKIHEAGG